MNYIAILISFLALMLSGGTFIFANVLKVDAVRLVILGTPGIAVKESIKLSPDYKLSFINLGNRPVAIVEMTIVLVRAPGSQDDSNCSFGDLYHHFKLNVAPFVLSRGELVVKQLSKAEPQGTYGQWSDGADKSLILGCLHVTTVTSDDLATLRSISLFTAKIQADGTVDVPMPVYANNSKSTVLVDDWKFRPW